MYGCNLSCLSGLSQEPQHFSLLYNLRLLPKLAMATSYLFPGITQMTLTIEPRQLHEPFLGNLKVTFLFVIKRHRARPACSGSSISAEAQGSDPKSSEPGQGELILETCVPNHRREWSLCTQTARN